MTDGVRVQADDFRRVMNQVKQADRKLSTALRKEVRAAGLDMVSAIQHAVQEPPPANKSGRHRDVGVRSAIAKGTSMKLSVSEKSAGIKVSTSARYLPENRKRMMRLYNKKSWRHPVFPRYKAKISKSGIESFDRFLDSANKARADKNRRKATWVEQPGRPYFGKSLEPHIDTLHQRLEGVLNKYVELISKTF